MPEPITFRPVWKFRAEGFGDEFLTVTRPDTVRPFERIVAVNIGTGQTWEVYEPRVIAFSLVAPETMWRLLGGGSTAAADGLRRFAEGAIDQ